MDLRRARRSTSDNGDRMRLERGAERSGSNASVLSESNSKNTSHSGSSHRGTRDRVRRGGAADPCAENVNAERPDVDNSYFAYSSWFSIMNRKELQKNSQP